MKKVKSFLILLCIFTNSLITEAQNIDTVYSDIIFRANIGGLTYRIKQDPKVSFRKKYLLKDTIKIDSINFRPGVHQDYKNNNIYIRGGHFYKWDLNNMTFTKLDSFNYRFYGNLSFYYKSNFYLLIKNKNYKVYKIHKYNPRTRKLSVFLDLTDELKTREDKKDIGVFEFIDHQNYVSIAIGRCNSTGILWREDYVYSFENKNFYKSNGTEFLKKTKNKILGYGPIKDIYLDGRYYGGYYKKYKYNEIIVFDENLERRGKTLTKTNEIKGYNIQNSKVKSINLESQLDTKKQVIIPVALTYKLDHLLYKIYAGEKISKSSLTGYGPFELGILKNMVFAKHNYGFDTPYYQAFYNLYRVYRDKMDSRTKDMNGKLTEADKKNLNLIKAEIARRKE